jgi:hypothetical protein
MGITNNFTEQNKLSIAQNIQKITQVLSQKISSAFPMRASVSPDDESPIFSDDDDGVVPSDDAVVKG